LNFNGESGSEPYTPTSQSFGASGAADGFYSPDLRGEFGAGLLDLHAMDDTELLSEVSYIRFVENLARKGISKLFATIFVW